MKILGTTDISYNIEQLLKEESQFLIFVSPYLKLNNRLKARMTESFKKVREVIFLFRENEINQNDMDWLLSLKNLILLPIQNLHAKIYLNENRCIVSSMNLYEYSQVNNHEIAVEFYSQENNDEYIQLLKELQLIINSSKNNYSIENIIDLYEDYSVGNLFYQCMLKFDLYNHSKTNVFYTNFCNWARNKVRFNENELYQDKTAILRSTILDKKHYNILKEAVTIDIIRNGIS